MLETSTVGSLPKSEYLAETEKLWPAWRLSGQALQRAKERAAGEWLRHQKAAGIHILTAGEQHRIHMVSARKRGFHQQGARSVQAGLAHKQRLPLMIIYIPADPP